MVFSSPTFLFLFLPLVLAFGLAAPVRARNGVLLAASLFFYAWGETIFVAVMLASIAGNYAAGLAIGRARSAPGRRALLVAAVAGNLSLLAWFKYANFAAENLVAWAAAVGFELTAPSPVHLPIGISFFTFQALSYVIDVYRGDCAAQKSPVRLALFISLFPQLIAGPIVRYQTLARQLESRITDLEGMAAGARRFAVGLAKKLLVANTLGVPADAIFALPVADLSPTVAWFGLACYTLQIYFDFSGYSDMAIGLGRMFGFHIPENFDLPYTARSITEFWRRWHISLSSWFRDYLYIPLGGSRRGTQRTVLNLGLVFLLCGLWHGASWNFVAWGAFHGAFLGMERLRLRSVLDAAPAWVARGYCLLAVALGWVLFRATDLAHAAGYLGALVRAGSGAFTARHLIVDFADVETLLAFAAAVVLSGSWWRGLATPHLGAGRLGTAASTAGLAALLLACGMKLADRTYDPFIYFRF